MRKPQRQTAFRIPTDLSDAMQDVKDRDGVPQAEQVRRALREWLEKRGALPAAGDAVAQSNKGKRRAR